MQDLYAEHLAVHFAEGRQTDPASSSYFFSTFKRSWSHVLKFRGKSQHAKCDDCHHLRKMLRDADSEAGKRAARSTFQEHIQAVMRDRRVDARLASQGPAGYGTPRLLHMRVDGMDQSKYAVPRWEKTKSTENLYRPRLGVTGVFCEGLFEQYVLNDPRRAKGANMQATLITQGLIIASQDVWEASTLHPK